MKYRMIMYLLMGLFLINAKAFSQDSNFYIFLCFGQSNMEGFPGIEPQDTMVDNRLQVLAAVDFPKLDRKKGNWYTAVPPLCRPSAGLCPADYFGRTMVAHLPKNIKVGIVNVSVAGCKIELFEKDSNRTYAATAPPWMKNIINVYGGDPYRYLVEMAKIAQKDGVIKGILLHQGESNPNDSTWTLKVKKIYDNLMKDLNLNPDSVPLLAGELVNKDQGGACAAMNSIIANLPQVIHNSYVIPSSGCIGRPDHLHFKAAGYRKLGARFAVKMLSLLGYEIAEPEIPQTPVETNATNTITVPTSEKKQLIPTVTIPAPPGSKGFGMPQTNRPNTNVPRRPRPSASVLEPREIVTTAFDSLSMSDPYILADDVTKTYYLTSSGGCIYKSKDLKTWIGPCGAYDVRGTWMEGINFVAAAEIHKVNGKYYYAATFGDRKELVDVVPRRYNVYRHQTMILVSDKAEGPYKLMNPDPNYDYLPHSWDIIDGSIYMEHGQPYMVFVHEWMQTFDGTMEYVKLSPDLSKTISDPVMLFRASESPLPLEMVGNGEMTYGLKIPGWVTDGPELYRTKTGKLFMLWASWGANRYLQCVAYSESGTIDGPWIQADKPLIGNNSGHGMIFTSFEGKRLFIVHHAEGDGPRKPQLFEIDDTGDTLVLGARYNP